MAATDKDTIYIDIDDEITGIIDKLKASSGKVVALVLPKRASVFQSIVNMKLLKRAADSDNKHIVLITSEAGLLPLAGMAGVHVAKTLSSKPEIPLAPNLINDAEETVGEDGVVEDNPLDPKKTIGQLAAKNAPKPPTDEVETLVLDDEDLPPEDSPDDLPKTKSFEPPAAKNKKDKTKKVPNFKRFRLVLIIIAVVVILAIIGFIVASVSLPKATITIKTNATNVDANASLNLSTTADSLNTQNGTIPAKLVTQQKTYTEQVTTTGQTNNGNKASGTVNMTAQYCGQNALSYTPTDVPAGYGLSSNGQTYITQGDTNFSSTGTANPKTQCITYNSTSGPTTITAQEGGTSYNGATSFSVDGRSDVVVSDNTPVTGGTDDIVQTVNQNDINNAKAKISPDTSGIKQDLENQLQQQGYYAIVATYNPGTPNITTSANVGAVASSVTVTETISYTMFGVYKSDLQTMIASSVDSQINTNKQSILDYGLSNANFSPSNLTATSGQVSLTTTAIAGPQLNTDSIKQEAEGQHIGSLTAQLDSSPNVTSASVKLSPFWISTIPTKPSRITVIIAKPTTTVNSSNSTNGSN